MTLQDPFWQGMNVYNTRFFLKLRMPLQAMVWDFSCFMASSAMLLIEGDLFGMSKSYAQQRYTSGVYGFVFAA